MNNPFDWNAVESHWDDYKDRIMHKWEKLTDSDMQSIHGDRQRLMQALQDRYQLSRDKVEKQVSDFLQDAESWFQSAKHRVMEVAEQGKHYVQDNSLADMMDDLRGVIRGRPMTAALVGLGVGYMMGWIFNSDSES